ncbi:MAG TPA: hypothetical protein DCE23_04985 [Firmicutes bacterium]|nr:hypothetical protein [Bacillota bacterium]
MKKKKRVKASIVVLFVIGLILYLTGLFFILGFGIRNSFLAKFFFNNQVLSSSFITRFKIAGLLLFIIGFIIFMIAIISLYKNDDIKEDRLNLIVEGKADVITIIVSTYVMIFMIVVCLLYDQLIGALLFGITIVIQSLVNWILIKYYSNDYKKK